MAGNAAPALVTAPAARIGLRPFDGVKRADGVGEGMWSVRRKGDNVGGGRDPIEIYLVGMMLGQVLSQPPLRSTMAFNSIS